MNAILQLLMPQGQLQSANQSSSLPSEADEVFQRMVNRELDKVLPPDIRKNMQMAELLDSSQFKQLIEHLDALLSSMGLTQTQKAQVLDDVTAHIAQSFMRGDTENLISFFEQILAAENPEELREALADAQSQQASLLVGIFGQHLTAGETGKGRIETHGKGNGSAIDDLLNVNAEPGSPDVMATAQQEMAANADTIPAKINAQEILAQIVEMFQEKEASFAKDVVKEGFDGPAPQPGLNSPEAEFLSLMKEAQLVTTGDTVARGEIEPRAVDMQARVDLLTGIKELVDRIQVRAEPNTIQTVFDLKPPNLGQTHLRVELSEQKVMLDFLVKVPEAKEIIQNSLNDLTQMFQDKGLVVEQVNVDVDPNLSFDQGLFSPDLNGRQEQGQGGLAQLPSSVLFDEETVRGYGLLYLDSEGVNCLA